MDLFGAHFGQCDQCDQCFLHPRRLAFLGCFRGWREECKKVADRKTLIALIALISALVLQASAGRLFYQAGTGGAR